MKPVMLLLSLFISCSVIAVDYGQYSGSVITEWLGGGRKMKLLEGFQYEDPNGMKWTAPKGSIVDGASIPTLAWSIVGSPFSGKYRNSSVIHDVACQNKNRTWEVVHLAFYYGMLASEVNILKAKLMYAGVYHFGPRWDIEKKIDNPLFHAKSNNKFLCNNQAGQVCSSNPLYDPRSEVIVKIPHIKKYLQHEEFNKLVESIKKGEKNGKPISIQAITEFK